MTSDGTELFAPDHFAGGAHLTDGTLAAAFNRAQTVHFNIGNLGALALGTPNVPTVDAMSVFGQINVPKNRRILVSHLHLVKGGTGGTLTVELWRRRSGVMTRLGIISTTDPADFSTAALVPSGDLALLIPGDYLYCQATAATAFSGGGANGLTVDVHFSHLA